MIKPCLIVRTIKQDDENMRPGSITPDKHWAYMLMSSLATVDKYGREIPPEGVYIQYREGKITLVMEKCASPNAIAHIANFVNTHGLTYEFPNNMDECKKCPGNSKCLASCHSIRNTTP